MLWTSRLERMRQPLAPVGVFFKRLGRNFLVATGVVAFSLALGTLGYHYFGGVGWVDGFLNAAMILTGMGPVDRMQTTEGKLFAAFYALYSGLAFLTMVVVLVTPIYHRLVHRFHLETERDADHGHKPGPPTPPAPPPPVGTAM
jgi:hypothetical protein